MNLRKFYGKYTSGANAIISDKKLDYSDYFNKKILKKYKIEIQKNIRRMRLRPKDLRNKNIMNVGTGREALAIMQFKPKHVYHYDISQFQINRLKNYIRKKKLNSIISSKQLDLSKQSLPKNKFDFIYLHGIIQHTDHPGKTLENLIYSLKLGGKMWFFFSRAGTLIRFMNEMTRRITKFLKINDFYLAMKTIEQALFKDNKFSDSIMDNAYVPNQNTFIPKVYLNFLKNNHIQIFGDSLLFRNNKKSVDHVQFHESVILFVKKLKSVSKIKKRYIESLSPKKVFKELDIKNYKNKNIIKIIKLFIKLEKKLKLNHQSAFAFVHNLEKLKFKYYKQYLNGKYRPMPNSKYKKYYHLELIRLIEKTLSYL